MKFSTAKKVVMAFLVGALIFCVLALIAEEAANTFMIGVLACAIIAGFFMATGLKCPYCGKHIIKNMLQYKNCPHCHRNLETGMKGKKGK
ncbi:MAG: hypothetical protein IKV47_00800 [Oscillospiraceae bacterium]|nr:hypothetical protein [Oscillospiraceae bacterium]